MSTTTGSIACGLTEERRARRVKPNAHWTAIGVYSFTSRQDERHLEGAPTSSLTTDLVAPGDTDGLAAVEVWTQVESRLRQLQGDFLEDSERQLEPASVEGLRSLLRRHVWLRKPMLSAEAGSGSIVATWRTDEGRKLSLRIVSRDKLYYVTTGLAATGTPEYGWGESSVRELFQKVPAARVIAC